MGYTNSSGEIGVAAHCDSEDHAPDDVMPKIGNRLRRLYSHIHTNLSVFNERLGKKSPHFIIRKM